MKYAIVESGGKQYKAVEGSTIEVDRMLMEPGSEVMLESVLLLTEGDQVAVGTPVIKGAKVKTTIVDHIKGPKLVIFRYQAKKRVRIKTGHRQQYTRLKIESIEVE